MHLLKLSILGLIAALVWTPLWGQEAADENGYDVMTRGPVHEAFAGTISYDPQPGIMVTARPPEVVEELPPDHRPEGDNVTWIPGYWAWDEEQENFLWISGIWRNLPPGREWVPGYWSEVPGGFQWTSGYWEDAARSEVSYLPEPPRSLETGPNIVAVSSDQIWIPGTWVWYDTRYAWRAGYWTQPRENWLWTPATYRWTPRGHVYVDGYWDYPVVTRGVLFAPVYFRQPIYTRPGYYYRPSTVININVFVNHLFLRPRYCHYYFGDYYAPRYYERGFYASYQYHRGRRGYDPIYAHRRWENRDDRHWDDRRREYFEHRRDNESARPPRTWAELSARPERDRRSGDYGLAERFDRVVGDRTEGRQRFERVADADREKLVSQRREVRKFADERRTRETRAAGSRETTPEGVSRVARAERSRSPIASRPVDESSDRTASRGTPPPRLDRNERDPARRQEPRTGADRAATARPERPDRSQAARGPQTAPDAVPGEAPATPRAEAETSRSGDRETAPRGETSPRAERSPRAESETSSRGDRQTTPRAETPASPRAERRTVPAPDRQLQPRTDERRIAPPARRTTPQPERQTVPRPSVRESAPGRQTVPTPPRSTERREAAPSRRPEQAPRVAPSAPSRPQVQPQRQQAQPTRPQVQPQRQQIQRPQPQPRQQIQRPQPQPRQQIQRPQPQPRPQIQRQESRPAPRAAPQQRSSPSRPERGRNAESETQGRARRTI